MLKNELEVEKIDAEEKMIRIERKIETRIETRTKT
jgi:hypothetical protein